MSSSSDFGTSSTSSELNKLRPAVSYLHLDAEKVVGITEIADEVLFLIKWSGTDWANYVPEEEAKEKYPQILIDYYQSNLVFLCEDFGLGDVQTHVFDENLELEEIRGCGYANGKLVFLIKWKESDSGYLVPEEEVRFRFPQEIIQYYEERRFLLDPQ